MVACLTRVTNEIYSLTYAHRKKRRLLELLLNPILFFFFFNTRSSSNRVCRSLIKYFRSTLFFAEQSASFYTFFWYISIGNLERIFERRAGGRRAKTTRREVKGREERDWEIWEVETVKNFSLLVILGISTPRAVVFFPPSISPIISMNLSERGAEGGRLRHFQVSIQVYELGQNSAAFVQLLTNLNNAFNHHWQFVSWNE